MQSLTGRAEGRIPDTDQRVYFIFQADQERILVIDDQRALQCTQGEVVLISSPDFSPGRAMIAQGFVFTTDFLIERRTACTAD